MGTEWPMYFVSDQSFVQPLFCASSAPTPRTKCSILLTSMISKSPGCIKWWHRCLNLNVAKASQSERTCEAISEACLHFLHSGLSTSSSQNRCSCKWHRQQLSLTILYIQNQKQHVRQYHKIKTYIFSYVTVEFSKFRGLNYKREEKSQFWSDNIKEGVLSVMLHQSCTQWLPLLCTHTVLHMSKRFTRE